MLPGLWAYFRDPCSIEGCNGVYRANGLCAKHNDQQRQQRRYAENPQYFKDAAKRWQAENRERYRARKRQHHQENPLIQQERNRRYYEANTETLKAATKAYARAHREEGREYRRRRKALLKSHAIGVITPELLAGKLVYWGERCWINGPRCTTVPETWDHVKPLSKGGAHVLANLRPACNSCNSHKRARWPYPTSGSWLSSQRPNVSTG